MSTNEEFYWEQRLARENEIMACRHSAAAEMETPHYLYRPRIFLDGNRWCALLGDDIQTGICGFGASPHDACVRFDKAWYEKIT